MIVVKDLIKKIIDPGKETPVLDKINFEIKENEFVSILGPVGCGKTTLLNIIAGLERPTAGKVFVNDEEVSSPRNDIGIIFQGSLLFPWKNVFQNVELSAKSKFCINKEIPRLVERVLEKVKMLEFANLYPSQLSGGMQQKTAFAKILVSDYRVLLMDEPFSHLDAQTRLLMQEELLKIWQFSKLTVLFVTHNIEEAIFLSDKIILLSSFPTRVLKIININIPRPRTEEIWFTKNFNEIRKEVWEIIKREITKSY